jgi:4-hydroxy-3-methylbut-2-en-1-yl diphosphate synthase IspG/GcpE
MSGNFDSAITMICIKSTTSAALIVACIRELTRMGCVAVRVNIESATAVAPVVESAIKNMICSRSVWLNPS